MRDRLDQLAKAAALGGICSYLVGFAVVAFHDARYGFIAFNAFRAKIIGAGIAFAVFFVPGFLSGARVYGRVGFDTQSKLKSDVPSRWNPFFLHQYRMSDVIFNGWALSFFYQFLLVENSFRWPRLGLYLGYIAIKTLPGVWTEERFFRHPVLFLLAAFSVDLGAVAVALYLQWFLLAVFLAWFLFVGLEADSMGGLLDSKVDLRRHSWPSSVLSAFILFAIFGAGIYPELQTRVGGGHLTPISFQFSSGALIDRSLESDDLLVDEAEDGYYVVKSKDDKSATFIPRSAVTLAFFGSERNPSGPAQSRSPR